MQIGSSPQGKGYETVNFRVRRLKFKVTWGEEVKGQGHMGWRGQSSRSRGAKDRFGGVAEASFCTPWVELVFLFIPVKCNICGLWDFSLK